MAKRLKCPGGLGVDGRRLWREVSADAADQGLELTPIEQTWLGSACKLVDQAAVLETALKGAPLYMKGSQGQDVGNPLVGELRQLHLAVNLTLARIKTDVAESSGIGVVGGLNHQRRGANIRWRGAGGA